MVTRHQEAKIKCAKDIVALIHKVANQSRTQHEKWSESLEGSLVELSKADLDQLYFLFDLYDTNIRINAGNRQPLEHGTETWSEWL